MKRQGGTKRIKRRGEQERFRIMGVVMIMGMVLVLSAGIWAGWNWVKGSALFAVQEIRINGISRVQRDWVLKAMDIKPGANLFRLDEEKMEKALLKDPWIRDVRISRDLPHTLVVTVKERRPIGVVTNGSTALLMDESGKVFKDAGPGETKGLIKIRVNEAGFRREKLRKFMKLIQRKGWILCKRNIKAVEISKQLLKVMIKGSDICLKFHLDEDLSVQFKRAERILYHLYSSGKYKRAQDIDLSIGPHMALARLR